ncbi:damage-control phosphatase ARMT1 family protein [Maribellus maritimus]|uniref:damage-control phosphatase ARMT1 family protein n=1 Tax=Maribellus maritimus TaxID=2870838 RepID=UPI001EE9EFDF|nr:ARMT1-like domain-containing protein [Maribellus maritimus]MCG6188740.1 ARMT1-like domain-containing protein [Maribellus maritimus]
MNYECLICQIKSLPHRFDKYEIPRKDRNAVASELIKKIAGIDLENSYSPEITRDILALLKKKSTVEDPYQKEKEESNFYLQNKYSEFQELLRNSDDPFNLSLRLAIAGNIIDFGPAHQFDVDETIQRVLTTDFAFDHSAQLKIEIEKARTILYLADNSGEIVLDKLFLETINHPNVWFAFRGAPVLNDATCKEVFDIGIDKTAKIISNGDDAPSTLLHRVSHEFKEVYNSADLIISKGMGNYEGLMNESDPRLFFLLMIKCPVIAEKIGAKKGDFVVKQNVN